jgi:hypothetical protein
VQLVSSQSARSAILVPSDLTSLDLRALSLSAEPQDWSIESNGRLATVTMRIDDRAVVLVERSLYGHGRLPVPVLPESREGDAWREAKRESLSGCAQKQCIDFIHTGWRKLREEEVRHVFYSYFVGALVTDSELVFRATTGWNRLLGRQEPAGLVAFFISGKLPAPETLAIWFEKVRSVI